MFKDVLLEVQNERYSKRLYLIDYIVYGLHLWYKIKVFEEICRKPIPQHPGLATSLGIRAVLELGPSLSSARSRSHSMYYSDHAPLRGGFVGLFQIKALCVSGCAKSLAWSSCGSHVRFSSLAPTKLAKSVLCRQWQKLWTPLCMLRTAGGESFCELNLFSVLVFVFCK